MYVYPSLSPLPTEVSAQSLTSVGVKQQFLCPRPANLVFVGFAISTATVSSGNIVVTVKKRNGGKYIDPSLLQVGEVIAFEVTTAAAGGGAAGAGYSIVQVNYSPEELANNSDFVQSA
jgi:hypothetical protein